MARLSAASVAEVKPRDQDLRGYEADESTDGLIEVGDLTSGMVTALPRTQRPTGSSVSIVNGRIREDWVGRRGGYPDYITKPNTDDIMRLISFHGEQNKNWVVRVARTSFYATSTRATWISFDVTGPYNVFARVDHAQLLGDLYVANIAKKILRVQFGNTSVDEIEDANAPRCKYVTAFADRILAAYIQHPTDGTLPFGLQWPINSDPTVWTGIGSGSENLIQSPSDTGDEITGIFSYGNLCVLFRERTIWHITRQPFSIAPFRFDPIITNLGCDMPYSITRISDEQGNLTGFMFADSRTNGIYTYTPGSRPVRIPASVGLEDQLFTGMLDPEMAMGAFDPRFQEYHLGLPIDASNTERLGKFWVVGKNGAITSDDGPVCTSIDVISDIGNPVVIDDLTGTINSLPGTIDSLAGAAILRTPLVIKGDTASQSIVEDLGTKGSHTFTWTSQNLASISRRRSLKMMTMVMSASSAGDVVLEWSSDLNTWTTIKTIADVSSLTQIGFKKQIGAKRNALYWRVTSLAADFQMTEWWAQVMELGLKHLS